MAKRLFEMLRIPPFVNHKGTEISSDWLAGTGEAFLGMHRFAKEESDDPEVDMALEVFM